jgi:hypothetical protein
MEAFNQSTKVFALKSPKRVTITIPYELHSYLVRRSNEEGRSLSNICAFLLENSITNTD